MQIENVATSALRPYARNARTHSKSQIQQIADSIGRFGFNNPVLIDDTGHIVAGHGRVEAAKLLGLSSVPTVRLSHLSPSEKRAYILADNKLALKAGWDREILAIELQELVQENFEIELTGFDSAEVDLIIEEAADGGSTRDEDETPAPVDGPTTSRPGDLWVLGRHRLLCADARDRSAYEKLMGTDMAEFVFTDPPYNVPINGHVSGKGKVRHKEFAMASGEQTEAQFIRFLEAVFEQLSVYTTDGSIHQHCMDWRHAYEMLTAGRAVYSELKNLVVWNKTNAGMGSFYRSQHELIFVWKNGGGPHINNFELGQHGRNRTNVWTMAGANTFKAGRMDELAMHPTVKPVALVAEALKDCSTRGGLVLDPFGGSGTMLIAAERTGRRARVMEIAPQYVDVCVRRWQQYTGKDAVQEGTDLTFNETAAVRIDPAGDRARALEAAQ
jgi:DNA modification methylase